MSGAIACARSGRTMYFFDGTTHAISATTASNARPVARSRRGESNRVTSIRA
jgi:hypothetical protein